MAGRAALYALVLLAEIDGSRQGSDPSTSDRIWSNVHKLNHHSDEGIPPFEGGVVATATKRPTYQPTNAPSSSPSIPPTEAPTPLPTRLPTTAPTPITTMHGHKQKDFYIPPTPAPTPHPTYYPTITPTPSPTTTPTASPTKLVLIHSKAVKALITSRHLNFDTIRYDWLLDHPNVWSRENVNNFIDDSGDIIRSHGGEIGVWKLKYNEDATLHNVRDEYIELATLLHVVTETKQRHQRLEKKRESRLRKKEQKKELATNAAMALNAAYTSGKIRYAISAHNSN